MQIVHFTDPGCPWAYSAEPQRMQLRWYYGDQLTWRTVLVGLAETGAVYEAKGFTTDKLSGGLRTLQGRFGMPIDTSERPRMAGTVVACRAVVAARLQDGANADALLRRLRIRAMGGSLLDADETIDGAAADVGIDAASLRGWMDDPATEEALRADMQLARSPRPAALLLDHKLAPSEDGGRRYTCPSYELHEGDSVYVATGFQPWATYDVAVANLAPKLQRRDAPSDVADVLEWADEPLATAEIAALLGTSVDAAHAKLSEAGASFDAVGDDGFWHAD